MVPVKWNVGDRVTVMLRDGGKHARVIAADRDSVTLRWDRGGEVVVDHPDDIALIRKRVWRR